MSIKTCMDELTCHKGIARWAVSKKTFHVLLDFVEFSINFSSPFAFAFTRSKGVLSSLFFTSGSEISG